MSKKPTVCGVQVHTWGTCYGGGSGIFSHLKTILYGGNPGHSSITLTIPDNDSSRALIEKYCIDDKGNTLIPHSKNVIKFSNNESESVYKIHFSAWRSYDNNCINLSKDISEDRFSNLIGRDFEWSERARSNYDVKQRIFKGILGKSTQSFGPLTMGHYGVGNNVSKEELSYIYTTSNYYMLTMKLQNLNYLKEKLKKSVSLNELFALSPSRKLLINNSINNYSVGLFMKRGFSDREINEILFEEKSKSFYDFSGKHQLDADEIHDMLVVVNSEIKFLEKMQRINDEFIKEHSVLESSFTLNRFLTIGALEDGSVFIPISKDISQDEGVFNGLNVKSMLRQMKIEAESKSLLTQTRNCSAVVSKVLESGVQQTHLKYAVNDSSVFGIVTPQTVYNSAIKIQNGIVNNEKSNRWHRLQSFNPGAPIENLIRRLIDYSLESDYLLAVTVFPIVSLIVVFAVIKIIVFPVNILGTLMVKLTKNNVVKNGSKVIDNIGVKIVGEDSGMPYEKIKNNRDQELKDYIEPKIIKINSSASSDAILGFAEALTFPDLIPIFSNESLKGMKKYVKRYHNTTPDDLIINIKELNLSLPEDLDYKDLDSLINELKLLSANRATGSVKELHDVLEHNKTMHAIHYEAKIKGSKKDNDDQAENSNPNIKPDL